MANRKSTKTFPTVAAGRWWLFISRVRLVVPIVVVMAAISFSLFLYFFFFLFWCFIYFDLFSDDSHRRFGTHTATHQQWLKGKLCSCVVIYRKCCTRRRRCNALHLWMALLRCLGSTLDFFVLSDLFFSKFWTWIMTPIYHIKRSLCFPPFFLPWVVDSCPFVVLYIYLNSFSQNVCVRFFVVVVPWGTRQSFLDYS